MSLRLAVLLCALAGIWATDLRADGLLGQQPSYTRIAAQCGEDPSRPSFSSSDYVKAFADAARELRLAGRNGERARINAIQQSVNRMKECKEEETRKFTLRPVRNCTEFINEYDAFTARAAALISAGKITTTDRDRVRETFRQPAENCVREMMTKCIDPTKTSDVDHVIRAVNAATDFGFVYTYARQTGIERFVTTTNPAFIRMSFCTDTDYACKGDPAACGNRIEQIKSIMETYIRR